MSLFSDPTLLMKYSLYAVYTLSTSTILLGLFLLIRKISQRSPSFEGDLEFDHEQIARELDREIRDLENLRNRIFPSSHFSRGTVHQDAADVSSEDANESSDESVSSDENVASSDTESSAGVVISGTPDEVSAALQSKVNELTEALKQSQKELTLLKEKASSGGGDASAAGAAKAKAEYDTFTKELELKVSQQKEEIHKQAANINHLEKIISEYQLFEEDFALVKKYRKENEVLRGELIKRGLPEADIVKILQAADALTPRTTQPLPSFQDTAPAADSAVAPASEAAAESSAVTPPPAEASAPTPAPEDPANATASPAVTGESSGETQAASAGAPAAAPTATATSTDNAAAVAPSQVQAPAAVPASAEASAASAEVKQAETEAMAESAVSEDELMAEFEKLLNEKDQST